MGQTLPVEFRMFRNPHPAGFATSDDKVWSEPEGLLHAQAGSPIQMLPMRICQALRNGREATVLVEATVLI
jgi:hypothetical protein